MTRKELPKSTRKYLRKKKARLRREIISPEKRKKEIEELYKKFLNKRSKK